MLADKSVLFCCVSSCMSVSDFIFSSEMESAAALSTAFVVSSRLSSGTYFKMSKSFCNSWSVKYSYSSRTGLFSRYSYGSEYDVLFPSRFLRFIEFCVSGGSCSSAPLTGVFVIVRKMLPHFLVDCNTFEKNFSTANRQMAGVRRSCRRLPLKNVLPVRRWCF